MSAVDVCTGDLTRRLEHLRPSCSLLMLSACVPAPHFTSANPSVEGHVFSAATKQRIANARITLTTAGEKSRIYETRSDASGCPTAPMKLQLELEPGEDAPSNKDFVFNEICVEPATRKGH